MCMKIVIYNPNSFGGNFEYALQIHKAYNAYAKVDCELVLPGNAKIQADKNIVYLLVHDAPSYQSKWLRRLYFIYRSFINPLRLFLYLRTQKANAVIFNDFDQLSAPFWSILFRYFLRSTTKLVILHDPDRDAYFPIKWLSSFSMKAVMKAMDVGLYHELLPDKSYYHGKLLLQKVPHGQYSLTTAPDQALAVKVKSFCGDSRVLSILGNIREEKNYELVIRALPSLQNVCLLIAGKAANSSVNIEEYKKLASRLGVHDRILWINRYLTESELRVLIAQSDVVSLYYKASFASQSGLLNVVASFRKKIVVADVPNALSSVVRHFSLAPLVKPDDQHAFTAAVTDLLMQEDVTYLKGWEAYLDYASWNNHVAVVLDILNNHECKAYWRGSTQLSV